MCVRGERVGVEGEPEHVRADVRARLVSEWVVKGGVKGGGK
jgi:hypothetical protein